MADVTCLLFLLLLCLLQLAGCELTLDQCRQSGFSPATLLCSSCDQLDKFNLSALSTNCQQCCRQDEKETETLKLKQHEWVHKRCSGIAGSLIAAATTFECRVCQQGDTGNVASEEMDIAFVKSSRPDQYSGLRVRYQRGANPVINLLDDNRNVVETLGIGTWDTDTVDAFLRERLAE